MKNLNLDMAPSELAETLLNLEGAPYSLDNYMMFRDIFNTSAPKRLMRAGRQVSKTITIAAELITGSASSPHHPIIYANSSSKQTYSFSTSKLDPFLIHSPLVYHNFFKSNKHVINNVYYKRLSNFSEIMLTYFSDVADRVRGRTGKEMYLDEVQDMLYDAIIDAEECLSAAPSPRFTYAGTSKTMHTSLEHFWQLSTQKEWVIPCGGCGKWNRPTMDCIGKLGLICKKCGKPLNTYLGTWHPFNPPTKENPLYIDGYWIPQIILPTHCCSPDKWDKLLEKLRKYPEYKFLNEVMGLPLGDGESPITKEMLQARCIETLAMYDKKNAQNAAGAAYIVGGIDWGGGGMSETSRTTLSLYAVHPDKPSYIKIFGKIFGTGEPVQHVKEIANILRNFSVNLVVSDHGGGNYANSHLKSMSPGTRIIPAMYTDQSAPWTWKENAGYYTVNRTTMIDAFLFDYIKEGTVRTMKWSEFEPLHEDLLNVYEHIVGEDTGKGRRIWARYPTKPDDVLHSMVLGWFACRVVTGMMDFRAFS